MPNYSPEQIARAVAAMVYISPDFFERSAHALWVPNSVDPSTSKTLTYQDYVDFYKKYPKAAEELWKIYEEKQDELDAWNATAQHQDNYLKRWKEVANQEFHRQLTSANLKVGGGVISRILNGEPIENILCPYKGKEALRNFAPIARTHSSMERARIETVRSIAQFTHQHFIDTNLLSDLIQELKKDEAAYTRGSIELWKAYLTFSVT